MVASVKWKLLFDKYCHKRQIKNVCNILDGALCDNSLQLKAVNFCYKNSILDTSRSLDPTVAKYNFPITVTGCLPHKLLLNWIRFLPNEKRLAKYHCNQGGIQYPYHDLRWSFSWHFFGRWKRLTPFRHSSSSKFVKVWKYVETNKDPNKGLFYTSYR